MELLFASQNAPPLPETDPELRRALLESLKTYEEQEARQPTFAHDPRVSFPDQPSSSGAHKPSINMCTQDQGCTLIQCSIALFH